MVIVCAGMSRSGSTIQYNMARKALELTGTGEGVGLRSYRRAMRAIKRDDTIVLKSEPFLDWVEPLVVAGQAKVFTIHRDLRDVALSLHWFYNARALHRGNEYVPMEKVVHEFLPEVVGWFNEWVKIATIVSSYDDIVKNPKLELLRICFDLGLEDRFDEIADDILTSVDMFSAGIKLSSLDDRDEWIDNSTLLTKRHISEHHGRSMWRKKLDQEYVDYIEKRYETWMRAYRYLNPA